MFHTVYIPTYVIEELLLCPLSQDTYLSSLTLNINERVVSGRFQTRQVQSFTLKCKESLLFKDIPVSLGGRWY